MLFSIFHDGNLNVQTLTYYNHVVGKLNSQLFDALWPCLEGKKDATWYNIAPDRSFLTNQHPQL